MVHSEGVLLRLLVVDDDPENLLLIRAALPEDFVQVTVSPTPQDAIELVQRLRPHLVLLETEQAKLAGADLLETIIETDPGINVILMARHYDSEAAVEAIKKGASDYLAKPMSPVRLRNRMEQFLSFARLRHRSLELERELLEAFQFEGMIGRSPQMLELFSKIRQIAPHFRTVLLTGETGTGKELVAKALHRSSPVSSGPFVAYNCAAIVETLTESELFGHVKGAFTGATQDKVGAFEFANRGVLMLDEIGELPLTTQAKLLRVLQEQQLQRVGAPNTRKLDVRVIAVTNRDLRRMVAEKTFREDLYYRLSMIEIRTPPLNQRKEDLSLLERHFIRHFAAQYGKQIRGLTRRAQTMLSNYSWPGNVREMENILGHACMMAQGEIIDVRDFPDSMRQSDVSVLGPGRERPLTLEENQRRYAREIVDRVGNKVQAADLLGISRTTLYRLLENKPVEQLEDVTQHHR
jgi:DNA-binding NtrC family response regulator